MLVNVITRYPPPPPDILIAAVVENTQQFGLHAVILGGRTMGPSVIVNEQQFGSPRIRFAAKELAPNRVANATLFGSPIIAPIVHGTRYIEPPSVANANQYGNHTVRRAPKVLGQAALQNLSQFGTPSIGVAEKHFSYSNPLGTGDRTAFITVTTSGGTTFDSPSHLVNGVLNDNNFWGFGPIAIKFDLGVAKVVRQARWIQDTSTTHNGLFQWQGSNDDAAYDDIGGTFNLSGPVFLCNTLLDNANAYRWYRLAPTEGASLSGTPYFREVEFYIEGSIDDPPA